MAKGLVRYQQCGVFHFLTFSCFRKCRKGAPPGSTRFKLCDDSCPVILAAFREESSWLPSQ